MSKLLAAIYTYKRLISKNICSRQVTGILPDDEYQECKKKLEKYDLLITSVDDKHQLEFSLPSDKNGLFALDLADLLQAPSRLLTPPEQFYLASEDYLYPEDDAPLPAGISNYLDASLFASTLYDLADHGLPGDPKAIFLHGEKLELSLIYKLDDLRPLKGLKKFILDFVSAEIHKEQKVTIIKDVLLEMLKNNEIDRLTLSCLIKRFSEFLERVNANYQLYVSEFSFEKIKAQVESEKFDFILKLNKIFSDIQNQLLAVPVALILVGSQMKVVDGFALKNIIIWCSALVFGFFMSLLIRNQRSALKAIKMEVDSQWGAIQSKHKYVAARLGSHYVQLKNRYMLQRFF